MAAVFAVLGYAGKMVIDHLKAKRKTHQDLISQLQELSSLLEESDSIFRDQNYKARRLMKLLRTRFSSELQEGLGFDETFFRKYNELNDEEKELHSLIRSTTINSMRRVNSEMSQWLKRNIAIKRRKQADSSRNVLAEQLQALELHLNQWQDKYEATIPKDERRCLVYLADEKKQGQGFPKKLQPALEEVLKNKQ